MNSGGTIRFAARRRDLAIASPILASTCPSAAR
jgi:hypothetical protein